MKTHAVKVLSAVGAAGALILAGLASAGGTASASTAPAQSAYPAPVSSLRLHGFQPAAASFTSPTWGVVLGGTNLGAGHASGHGW